MYKALHPRFNKDRLYMSSKKGGRRLASIENSVDKSIRRLEEYMKKEPRKTDYSDQKQFKQHKNQQNNNDSKTKL